jgi:RNA polymerase sigma-32 factor
MQPMSTESTWNRPRRSSSFPSGPQGDTLRSYLRDIKQHELLTSDEEQALAQTLLCGDAAASERLIKSNLRLVVKIALEYQSSSIAIMDLIQEGNLGLMQAVKKFDPSRKIRLSSYAQWWIRAFILKYLMDNHQIVKIGTTQAQRRLFYNLKKAREQLLNAGVEPTTERIADLLHVRIQDVQEMEIRLDNGELSLDAPLGYADSERTLMEHIPSPISPSDTLCAQRELEAIISDKLEQFRQTLRGRDIDLWERRLLSDSPVTLQQMGDSFGVSRERARQLDLRVRNKLEKFIKKHLKSVRNVLDDDVSLFA